MRTTIDHKIVEMKFNNENFEKNVQKTMTTLDKLKEKLQFNDAAKGLNNIHTIANKMSFVGLSNAIESVRTKFSAMEVFSITALTKIANKAVTVGGNLVSALTIDPVKTGFNEYETKLNAIQTILSNTANKGTTMADVTATLDELNTYADKTIYNFAEMTRNIGTFTAAGVGLEKAASSIQGIANLAAASGSTSQQASTAMYQLSQAMAAGTVKLVDWNSVVNAGMGGQKFQEALKATAREHGIAVDELIKKNGSFRESLQEGWLSADILNKTLNKFTVQGATEYAKSMMKSGKYTQAQADALLKEAQAMEDAATKVKTFTQLWSTLKETAQSGWAQSWEIIIGNFEEARELLTDISDRIGGVLNASSDSRNSMLKEWKDLGGRKALVDALTNTFEALAAVIKPIREAFGEIFPPLTGKQLLKFSEGIRNLTARMKISDETADLLKRTFKGVFSVIKVGVTLVTNVAKGIWKLLGNFTGIAGALLKGSATLGDFCTRLGDSARESNFFGKAIDKLVGFLQNGINKVKEFGAELKAGFKAEGYEGFIGFLKGLWEFLSMVGDGIMQTFGNIGQGLANMFNKGSFTDLINSFMVSGLLVNAFRKRNDKGFLEEIADSLTGFVKGITGKVTGILNGVKDTLKSYQEQLQAGTLLKIASAIGILAASLFVISTIDAEALGNALRGMTVLFAELLGSMFLFTKMPDMKGTFKASMLMTSMATSLLILAAAMKIIGSMDPIQAGVGLIGVAGGIAALVIALNKMPNDKKFRDSTKAIRSMSVSLLILAGALKIMGSMSITEMGIALLGMAAGLGAMVGALWILPKDLKTKTSGMIGMALALVILAKALKSMGSLSLPTIGKGLLAVAGSLLALTLALKFMPKNMISMGIGLIGVATALLILHKALSAMGGMSLPEIGKGLLALGGALLLLSVALIAMKTALPGAGALIVASVAVSILAGALTKLGDMSVGEIVKSLLALLGAFALIGGVAVLLAPVAPALLALSGTFALFGVGAVALGVGLGLIATGVTALGAALAAGVTGIVAGLTVLVTGILQLVPAIIKIISDTIIGIAIAIGEAAPALVESLFKLLTEVMRSLAVYTPLFAGYLIDFLVGILDVATEKMPELVGAVSRFIAAFFGCVADEISNFDGGNFLKGVIAVGLMSGIVYALAGVSSMIGPAMLGLLGIGALLAELAIVLALVGQLNKISGLADGIVAAGDLLEKIGTAIGQFIGGLAGGIAQGFTNSMPAMAKDLSEFMKELQPFIDGARDIDKGVIDGVKNLVAAVSAVTLAGFGQKMADFLTIGRTPIEKFSQQLVALGKGMSAYGKEVADIDAAAITASAEAAKGLTDVANAIPKSGGLLDIFTGHDSLLSFALQLVPFGKAMKEYATAVTGIDTGAINQSAEAAKGLTDVAKAIPDQKGFFGKLFTGDNTMKTFATNLKSLGTGLKEFSDETVGIVPENVIACSQALKNLAETADIIPDEKGFFGKLFTGDNTIKTFASNLEPFGIGLKDFSNETVGIVPENVEACSLALKNLAETADIIPDNKGFFGKLFTGDNTIKTFASNLEPFGTGLKEFSDATTGVVPENVEACSQALKNLAETADIIPDEKGFFGKLFTGDDTIETFASRLKPFGTGLKEFSDETAGIIPENIKAATDGLKTLADISDVILDKKGLLKTATFAETMQPLGEGIKNFSIEVAEIKPEKVTAAATAASTLADMAETVPKDSTKITSFGENLITFGEKLKSYFEKTKDITSESISLSKKAIESIKTATDGLKGESLNGLSDAISKLVESLKKMSGISTESIKGFTEAMAELGKVEVKTITESFNTAGTQLEEIGKNVISKIITGIRSKDKDIKTAGTESANKVGEGLSADNETLTTACKTLVDKSATAIKSNSNAFYKAGGSLVTGFANGITADTYKAEAAASAMAKAADTAARNTLKINSPSKVFESIGSGVPEGFVNGIGSYGSSIKNSVNDMGNSAISSMKRVLSNIVNYVNTDIDTQPTIRPVLDLSDVRAEASTLGSMFNNVSVGANLGAISSSMNARLQNGNNDDVVSAITKLGKTLGNTGGDTYNINGVSVDDESGVRDAVQTIVRAAKMERRV